MTSHKVIHGRLAKGKNFTNQDAFHMIHEMSHGQRSLFREMALQHLGRPPSKFWGEQPMPLSFPNIDKPTMVHIVRALNHPHHVTSELILQNQKSAAGWASMGRAVAEGAEKVGEVAGRAASFVGRHMDTILKVGNAIHTGIGLGRATGIIDNDSAIASGDDLLGTLLSMGGSSDSGEGFYRPNLRKKNVH